MHRLLIDTDPGVDDSMMIQWALKRADVTVEAMTAVFGNNPVDITSRNAHKNLEVAGRAGVPVARGANKPLTRPYTGRGSVVHGKDGLGESNLPPPSSKPIAIHAANLLVERIMAAPGEMTLLAVGPLTNVALAVSLEPTIAQNVKQFVIMGGATVRGNASPVAEANIRNDPEAARIVFNAGWTKFVMAGLDVTLLTRMDDAYLAKIQAAGTPVTNFISAIARFYKNSYKQRSGWDTMPVHDSSALAYILDPSLFKAEHIYVDVETHGERTSGQTVADFRGQFEQAPNCHVLMDVDAQRMLDMYLADITAK